MIYTTFAGDAVGNPIEVNSARPIRVKFLSLHAATIPFTTPSDGACIVNFGGSQSGEDSNFTSNPVQSTQSQSIFLRVTDQSSNCTVYVDFVCADMFIQGLDQTYKYLVVGYEFIDQK